MQYPMTVSFVDVGQGDGAVIECEDIVVLVDGGDAGSTYKFNNYIRSRGIKSIDCYIATHPHADHIGAIPGILSVCDVETFILPEFSELNMPATKTYENLLLAVAEEDCEVIFPKPGEALTFGSLTLDFFAPVEQTDNYNDMSIVFRATYGKTSFLFAGDAEKNSEKLMLNKGYDLNADVLKVGHHGSSTSSSPAFIDSVSPDFAVISCGKNNEFGHPAPEVLKSLENYGTKVFRTDLNGTIVFNSDGNKIIKE